MTVLMKIRKTTTMIKPSIVVVMTSLTTDSVSSAQVS